MNPLPGTNQITEIRSNRGIPGLALPRYTELEKDVLRKYYPTKQFHCFGDIF